MNKYEGDQAQAARLDAKPVTSLFSDALEQFSQLMRSELSLARAETFAKIQTAVRASISLALAAVFLIPALVLLMMALAAFLTESGWSLSASYLISGVVGLVICGILAAVGASTLRAISLTPDRTINQIQKDVSTFKGHVRTSP